MANKRKQPGRTPGTTSFVVAVLAEVFRRAEAHGRRQSAQLRAIHRAALAAVLSSRAAS